jgi:hypothetical protein
VRKFSRLYLVTPILGGLREMSWDLHVMYILVLKVPGSPRSLDVSIMQGKQPHVQAVL